MNGRSAPPLVGRAASRPDPKRPIYHQSEIQVYLKCGKMWEFRYQRGIRIAPSAALTIGSSVDAAVSLNLSQKTVTGRDVKTEEVLEAFSTDFESRAEWTNWGQEDPGRQKDIGVQLLKVHHQIVAPKLRPQTVQESFAVQTSEEFDLGGTIDFTEESGTVVDTKTSRSPYDPSVIRRAIQPALYDYAYEALRGRPSSGFRYDVLVKPTLRNAAQVQQISAKLGKPDREWLFETVRQVHRGINAGVAMPAPEGSWYCSPEWCGYWSMCKGRKAGK